MGTEFQDTLGASRSPLDIAEHMFQLLGCEPAALVLNPTGLTDELPQQPIPLPQLRDLLADRRIGDRTRDAVWRALVTRAHEDGPAWLVGAVGIAIPALRTVAGQVIDDCPGADPADVGSEVLAAFIEAVRTADPAADDLRERLHIAALRGGSRARRAARSGTTRRPPYPHVHDLSVEGRHERRRLRATPSGATAGTSAGPALHRTPPGEALTGLSPMTASADQRAEVKTSARSRSSSDAQSGHCDSKGGSGTASGSARISSYRSSQSQQWRPAARRNGSRRRGTRGITWSATWQRAVRSVAPPGGRHRRRQPARWQRLTRVLLAAAVAALIVITVATGALASALETSAAAGQGRAVAAPADLNAVFTNLRNWLIGLLVSLATLMLTLGGLRYLVAGGDPGEVQKAKAALKASAFGYGLAVLAPLFVSVLKRVVGG
ncbi:pilin [Planobispora rosea]|uniref:pilin n=1 Tax=Planobispora rosea TaxID=35762 RepID=UPI000AFB8792|nr:pilin [Planobispora rosea]